MTDLLKVQTRIQYAVNGDFQTLPTAVDFASQILGPESTYKAFKVIALMGGTSISMATFSTIDMIYIRNEDLTNTVTATWNAANSQTLLPQTYMLVPRCTINSVGLTASVANCMCTLIVVGI